MGGRRRHQHQRGPDRGPTPTPTPEPPHADPTPGSPTPTPTPTPDPDADSDALSHADTYAPTPTPAGIKISQVYGGGGNAGRDPEQRLHRALQPDGADVSRRRLVGPVRSAGGTTWRPQPLSGTIAAGGYYLVQEAAGAGGTLPLPDPGRDRHIAMSATSGKVALLSTTTLLSGACPTNPLIDDFVGYGSANCSETAPTGQLSNTTAALRNGNGQRHQQQPRRLHYRAAPNRAQPMTPRRR